MKADVKMKTAEERITGIVTRKGTNKSRTNKWQKIETWTSGSTVRSTL